MQDKNEHIEQLIRRCKKGDRNAQFSLYELYYKAMYNTAYRILKNSYEAEDMMQEAFMNAFTKLDTYKGEVAFGAWLKKIVINRSLTQLKKIQRLDETALGNVEYKLEAEANENTYGNELNVTDLKAREIIDTMQKMKENYRLVLTLSLVEGYDNEEIAQIMQITNENCRTMISRAKNRLRKLLAETALVK